MPTVDELLCLRDSREPLVIAHRGFSGLFPENTLIAFEQASGLGVDMIELDVTLTRDGQVIVLHDETLDRTTSGEGPAMSLTLAEIEQLDCGSWFSSDFEDERIPTLLQVFELLASSEVAINVEIKGEAVLTPPANLPRSALPRAVADLVRQHGFERRVVVSSFEPLALHELKDFAPEIERASLFNKKLHRGLATVEITDPVASRALSVSWRQLSARRVQQCHNHGLPIFVYTLDQSSEMRQAIELGVDGIFTNRPDRLIGLLEDPA